MSNRIFTIHNSIIRDVKYSQFKGNRWGDRIGKDLSGHPDLQDL